MSEELHSGLHPHADVLNAFLEGLLPEHERAVCINHLAECAQCREVVSLAGHAAAVEQIGGVSEVRTPFWKRLFRPMPVTVFAVTAIMVTATIGLYRMIRSAEPHLQVAASALKPVETPPAPIPATQAAPEPVQQAPVKERESALVAVTAQPPAPVAAIPPPPPPPPPVPLPQAAPAAANARAFAPAPAIAGTVTDRAGGVVANARVELRNDETGVAVASAANTRGEFSIAGLTPGKYDLRITAPGFKTFVKSFVDVQPQEIARVDSILDVGATTDTVTVTAEAPLLKTESGEISHQVDYADANSLPLAAPRASLAPNPLYMLPDGSKPLSFALKGRIVLAVDSAGALFLSDDQGKSWNRVNGKWKGRVVSVQARADAMFELTTDPASAWVSRDGRQWSKIR